MNLLEALGIMGANTMSKIGSYIIDRLDNGEQIEDILNERSNNENREY